MTDEALSAEIARRLFGLTVMGGTYTVESPQGVQYEADVEPYASDHNAAMGLVVPEMRRRGYDFELADDMESGTVVVMFIRPSLFGTYGRAQRPFGEEPRAICLAALAALDAEEGMMNHNHGKVQRGLCWIGFHPICCQKIEGLIFQRITCRNCGSSYLR